MSSMRKDNSPGRFNVGNQYQITPSQSRECVLLASRNNPTQPGAKPYRPGAKPYRVLLKKPAEKEPDSSKIHPAPHRKCYLPIK